MLAPSIILTALATVGFVNAQGSLGSWHPAGPDDCMHTIKDVLFNWHD
jgi:hypothetical protein